MVTPAELVDAAVKAGLDLIAITDHDTMAAAREVRERGDAAGLAVVMGQETTTAWPAQTHVLGWFLEKPIKRSMSVADTVKAIHTQGALAIIPHPFMPTYFASIQPDMLRKLIQTQQLDGIELVFTAPTGASRRNQLEAFYKENEERLGAAVGGSDCHFGLHDIAQAVTEFDTDFRTAVEKKATRPRRLKHDTTVPMAMAVRQQWRSLVDLPLRRLRGQL